MDIVRFIPNPDSDARVVGYLHDSVSDEFPNRKKRPCIVIYPGGGYMFLSERESDPPGMAFFAKGYQVFILYYSIQEKAADLRPLMDGSLTLMKIRENSKKWHIISDQIAILGFSAGGHAAASLGTLWDTPELKAKLDTKGGLNKPNAMVLCYPVVTVGKYTHKESAYYVCGGTPEGKKEEFFSLEKQVSKNTPPTFLWHTVEDGCVPVENSMMFAAALQQNHIPFECHLFQKGGHGMSMCTVEVNSDNPHCASWFSLCTDWLGDLFNFQY